MKKLDKEIQIKGLGQPCIAKEIKRQGKVCLYLRDDDVYEVFKVKVAKATVLKGINYEDRETYPNNEDFGINAFCYHGENASKKAMEKFDKLLNRK